MERLKYIKYLVNECGYLPGEAKEAVKAIENMEVKPMRNPERIDEVLQVVSDVWHKVPDLRFGQLICNLQLAESNDLFYVEDDKFIELLKEYFNTEHK